MASTIAARKTALRKEVKRLLKTVSAESCRAQSCLVAEQLISLPEFRQSRSVSIYLPIPGEIDTLASLPDGYPNDVVGRLGLIGHCLHEGKQVYIPKVVGMNSEDMLMLRLSPYEEQRVGERGLLEQVAGFPRNHWGIAEPTDEEVATMKNGLEDGDIDLVLVPGVAFDARCNRLGRGKGYYDCFLRCLQEIRGKRGLPAAVTVGVAMTEQLVEDVPCADHDYPLDFLVSTKDVFRLSAAPAAVVEPAAPGAATAAAAGGEAGEKVSQEA